MVRFNFRTQSLLTVSAALTATALIGAACAPGSSGAPVTKATGDNQQAQMLKAISETVRYSYSTTDTQNVALAKRLKSAKLEGTLVSVGSANKDNSGVKLDLQVILDGEQAPLLGSVVAQGASLTVMAMAEKTPDRYSFRVRCMSEVCALVLAFVGIRGEESNSTEVVKPGGGELPMMFKRNTETKAYVLKWALSPNPADFVGGLTEAKLAANLAPSTPAVVPGTGAGATASPTTSVTPAPQAPAVGAAPVTLPEITQVPTPPVVAEKAAPASEPALDDTVKK